MCSQVCGHVRLRQGDFILDAEFAFPAQGVTALFGPSGAGKSTLLRCLAGLEKRARGHLRVGEQTWLSDQQNLPPHKRPIGYVFQEANLLQHLNVRDNLLFGYKRLARHQRQLHLDEVVQRLGLSPLLQRRPQGLSGGERQRVAIGRALLTSPELLLLDEPLLGLDTHSKGEILPYLENLRDLLAVPVVYVSHSHEEVARLADYLLLMRAGTIVDQGATTDLVNQLNSPLASADESFSLLHCTLESHLAEHHLSQLRVGSQTLLVPHTDGAAGQSVRLRIQARDISLCLSKPKDTSILNILPVQVREIAAPENGQRLLLLASRDVTLSARISEMSFQHLALHTGQDLYAQIKSVALLNQP